MIQPLFFDENGAPTLSQVVALVVGGSITGMAMTGAVAATGEEAWAIVPFLFGLWLSIQAISGAGVRHQFKKALKKYNEERPD